MNPHKGGVTTAPASVPLVGIDGDDSDDTAEPAGLEGGAKRKRILDAKVRSPATIAKRQKALQQNRCGTGGGKCHDAEGDRQERPCRVVARVRHQDVTWCLVQYGEDGGGDGNDDDGCGCDSRAGAGASGAMGGGNGE